jgi:autotransporter strand-loop-strand O-heptosyltransferase
MKICNVTPGLIPIPPNGWGAVEKIIWEIHQNLLKLGHQSEIKYLDEVKPNQYDIVHIHVANLALIAAERGIPYYFTVHDHHAYLYGKDSALYKENRAAIEKSIQSFVPAQYLVDYFNVPGKVSYFSHGVNTDLFLPRLNSDKIIKLLCVANNGYAGRPEIDRKGFRLAIEAAKELGLSITIAGPSNNKSFFEANPDLLEYHRLTVKYNLNEQELVQLYQEHDIFLHPSELEAGHPNLTMLEAMSSGLPVVGTFEDGNGLFGLTKIERNKDDIIRAIIKVIGSYYDNKKAARFQAQKLSWENRTTELISIYETKLDMKEILINAYNYTEKLNKEPKKLENKFDIHFVDGAFLEITGPIPHKYKINFINNKTNNSVYEAEMSNNCWAKTDVKYFIDYSIQIENLDTKETFLYSMDFKDQRVFIALDSKSLGDTLAWFPYVDEFRKKYNCKLICSTFHNNLFKTSYPDIEFVEPGTTVHNLYVMYTIGWFYKSDGTIDFNRNVNEFKNQPLQKTACDILGLDYVEVKPKYYLGAKPKRTNKVGIAIHSTTQAKYWNNPEGWSTVVKYLKSNGYDVVLLSKEGMEYMGNKAPAGIRTLTPGPLENVIKELESCQFFVGIGSGLSWLSWMTNTPTLIISGFSESYTETQQNTYYANTPEGKCKGCFNMERLNPGDWNWCPYHKGTDRQFECSKSIDPWDVIKIINQIMKNHPL